MQYTSVIPSKLYIINMNVKTLNRYSFFFVCVFKWKDKHLSMSTNITVETCQCIKSPCINILIQQVQNN
jgi:hypothetical protein